MTHNKKVKVPKMTDKVIVPISSGIEFDHTGKLEYRIGIYSGVNTIQRPPFSVKLLEEMALKEKLRTSPVGKALLEEK